MKRPIRREASTVPFRFDCVITTVYRQPTYLGAVLDCLGPQPVRLVVGSPKTGYLRNYKAKANIEIITAPRDEWEKLKDKRVQHRASWNYWRALVHGVFQKDSSGLVVLEDDVILASDWRKRLCGAIAELNRIHHGKYVLSLYAAYGFKNRRRFKGFSVPYPTDWFFGTQAMYYPTSVLKDFSHYMFTEGVQKDRRAYDLLLKDFLDSHKIPLAMTYPCLAQHIGKVSTGLGAFHCSPEFDAQSDSTK